MHLARNRRLGLRADYAIPPARPQARRTAFAPNAPAVTQSTTQHRPDTEQKRRTVRWATTRGMKNRFTEEQTAQCGNV